MTSPKRRFHFLDRVIKSMEQVTPQPINAKKFSEIQLPQFTPDSEVPSYVLLSLKDLRVIYELVSKTLNYEMLMIKRMRECPDLIGNNTMDVYHLARLEAQLKDAMGFPWTQEEDNKTTI